MSIKYKTGGITLPKLKIHYKFVVIKTIWHWITNEDVKWSRIKNTEIKIHTQSLLISSKAVKNTQKWQFNKAVPVAKGIMQCEIQ